MIVIIHSFNKHLLHPHVCQAHAGTVESAIKGRVSACWAQPNDSSTLRAWVVISCRGETPNRGPLSLPGLPWGAAVWKLSPQTSRPARWRRALGSRRLIQAAQQTSMSQRPSVLTVNQLVGPQLPGPEVWDQAEQAPEAGQTLTGLWNGGSLLAASWTPGHLSTCARRPHAKPLGIQFL